MDLPNEEIKEEKASSSKTVSKKERWSVEAARELHKALFRETDEVDRDNDSSPR